MTEQMESWLRAIREDAAQRSGLPLAQVKVGTPQPVTWNDGSLGCAEPDQMYTQALVPGYLIEVQAAGQTLRYHANRRGYWIYCPPGRGAAPLPDTTR